jgi:hypothetical protein
MSIFVFRPPIARSLDPIGICPITDKNERQVLTKQLKSRYKHETQEQLPPWQNVTDIITDFVQEELMNGRLRQGWGFPHLDLRQDEKTWTAEYMFATWKYWAHPIDCYRADGRWRIISLSVKNESG